MNNYVSVLIFKENCDEPILSKIENDKCKSFMYEISGLDENNEVNVVDLINKSISTDLNIDETKINNINFIGQFEIFNNNIFSFIVILPNDFDLLTLNNNEYKFISIPEAMMERDPLFSAMIAKYNILSEINKDE